MADDSIKFQFDLDTKEALGALNELRGSLDRLSEVKSVDQLVTSFISLSTPIFAVGAAILAFKTAFDLTLEGEAIERVSKQFDILSQQAGVSSIALKEGIEKSIGGMTDMDSALKASNKAIVELGENARRIPEIFELARKVTLVFGGDVISNFDHLSMALANGNARMLKHMGIVIDTEKAERAYAQSIGTTVSALTEQEKRTAVMNEALDLGQKKFAGITTDATSLTIQMAKLKTGWKEFTDGIAVAVEHSTIMQKLISGLGTVVSWAGEKIKGNFGSEAEQSAYKIKGLNEEIQKLQERLKEPLTLQQSFDKSIREKRDADIRRKIEQKKEELAQEQKVVDSINAETERKKEEQEKAVEEKSTKTSEQALLKRAEQKSKFEKELIQMTASRVKEEIAVETDANDFQELLTEQRYEIEQQYNAKIVELQQKGALGKEITAAQANQLIEELEAEKTAKILQYDVGLRDEQLKLYANQVAQAKTASDGIVAAFKQGGAQAQRDLNDFGKMGTTVFTAVSGGAKNFFIGLGQGAKSSGQLMKEFLFGSIADVAEAQGQLLLASGIGTFNPVQIAEGGALLALSGLLRSQAGGSSSGVGSAGGGGGGAGGAAAAPVSAAAIAPVAQETPKKTVTVQFMGDYLETAQTQQRLVDLIRQETDVTDYKYQQIPVR